MNLSKLFNPQVVAVIGASPDKEKVGYALFYNLTRTGARKVYPVNISQREVLGVPCVKSVFGIKEKVDLALIAVRAEFVPQALTECGKKKIPFVAVISAGFKEIGAEGKKLEDKLKVIAKKYKITLLGPNCLGIIDAHTHLNASFAPEDAFAGNIAFVSQSGALGTAILDWARTHNVGFSKFISLGNEAGLTEVEILEYLAKDVETKAILIYLESVSDGRKFMCLAKEITRTKPVVLIRAGRSSRGQAAVASHTGSLAGEDAIFTAACRQSGIIVVDSIRELVNLAKLFQMGITKPLLRLAVLTNGGGPSIVAADHIELSRSLALAALGENTKRELRRVLPPMAAVGNPVDIIGDALPPRYNVALGILMKDKNVDAILTMLTPQMMTDVATTADVLARNKGKKSIIPVFIGGESTSKGIAMLRMNNLINFDFPDDAIGALDALANAKSKLYRLHRVFSTKSGQLKIKHLENVKDQRILKMMDFTKTGKLLRACGMRIPGVLLKHKKDLESSMRKLGKGPFALKVISQDIIHKTDIGGVKLYIRSARDAEKAWDDIMHNVRRKNKKAKLDGLFLQPMGQGVEVIIGMKRDLAFGPVVVFGLGGIYTEALKDVSMRVAPVDGASARAMIEEIRGFSILRGARGMSPVNMKKLERIVTGISRLALAHPEIKEIDLNPVKASSTAATVIDVRMMI